MVGSAYSRLTDAAQLTLFAEPEQVVGDAAVQVDVSCLVSKLPMNVTTGD